MLPDPYASFTFKAAADMALLGEGVLINIRNTAQYLECGAMQAIMDAKVEKTVRRDHIH